MKKTWAREFSIFGVWLPFVIMVASTWWQATPDMQIQLISSLMLPVATLVGGAFGLKGFRYIKEKKESEVCDV